MTLEGYMSGDGLKFDDEKIRMDLIPVEVLEELGKVLTYGIKKGYGEDSWKKVEPHRYVAALLRHFTAWKKGEAYDPESNLKHLSHLLCNAAFLLYLDERG